MASGYHIGQCRYEEFGIIDVTCVIKRKQFNSIELFSLLFGRQKSKIQ